MNCPNCHQPLDAGAAFCGNCGRAIAPASASAASPAQSPAPAGSPIARVLENQTAADASHPAGAPLAAAGAGGLPGYALAVPGQYSDENKARLAPLFGAAGLAGALLIPLLGLVLGLTGVIMATMSRAGSKRGLNNAGLIVSGLAILASLGMWTYAAKHYAQMNQAAATKDHSITAPPVAASKLSTPCYAAGFAGKLNVSNSANSCDMAAFNGATLGTSSDAYKVYATASQTATAANFATAAKTAIEKDISTNLPGFTVTDEGATEFAGSPAYAVNADSPQKVAIVEAAVFHQVADGENIFILVHAASADRANLNVLENQWQWK